MKVDTLLDFKYQEGDWTMMVAVKKFAGTSTTYMVVSQNTKDERNNSIIRETFPDEQSALRDGHFYVDHFKKEILSHLTKETADHV